ADDMLKPTGAPNWVKVGTLPLFQAYLPLPEEQKVGDAAEALEPIELDFNWKRRHPDEDDDVDMIPLIDISLVLLIFFMMTTTVAAISRIAVPDVVNAAAIATDPKIIRVEIDLKSGAPLYAIALADQAPAEEDDKLGDLISFKIRLGVRLGF